MEVTRWSFLQWRFYVGAREAQAVIASQMMRGQAPKYFFPKTATAFLWCWINQWYIFLY